jgi:hypothetical protein
MVMTTINTDLSKYPSKTHEYIGRYLDKFGDDAWNDLLSWDIMNGSFVNDKTLIEKFIQMVSSAIDNEIRIEDGRIDEELFPVPKDADR